LLLKECNTTKRLSRPGIGNLATSTQLPAVAFWCFIPLVVTLALNQRGDSGNSGK